MLVQDLDGKKSKWKLTGYLSNDRMPSNLHVIARDILKKKQLVTFIPYKMVQISAVTAHTVVRAVYSGISAGSNNPIM